MEIFLAIVFLIGSFLLIIWGGDRFVDASIALSKKLRIPPAIIGATITSIGTTLPELLVTLFAAGSSSSGLAVGNALGSMAFNGAVIGGILLIFCIISLKDTGKSSSIMLLLSVFLTLVMSIDKKIAIWECIILIVIFSCFMLLNYLKAKQVSENNAKKQTTETKPTYKYILQFLLSAAAIGFGAHFMVDKAKFLASLIGMSETIIGLTIVSIGSSLPELITTINAIRKKEAGLGLGNIIGANIINCTLLMSLSGLMSGDAGLMVDMQTLFITLPVTLAITLLLLVPTIIYNKTHKWQGFSLLGLYLIYYTYLILNGLGVLAF